MIFSYFIIKLSSVLWNSNSSYDTFYCYLSTTYSFYSFNRRVAVSCLDLFITELKEIARFLKNLCKDSKPQFISMVKVKGIVFTLCINCDYFLDVLDRVANSVESQYRHSRLQ